MIASTAFASQHRCCAAAVSNSRCGRVVYTGGSIINTERRISTPSRIRFGLGLGSAARQTTESAASASFTSLSSDPHISQQQYYKMKDNTISRGSMLIKRCHQEVVDSTQDVCKDLIRHGILSNKKQQEPDDNSNQILVVSASEQTKGRGTNKRSWTSMQGNTFVTIAFPMDSITIPYTLLPLKVGTIIASQIYTLLQQRGVLVSADPNSNTNSIHNDGEVPSIISVKWPNDVLIDDKKIAGVLIETVADHAYTYYFLIGIGINVACAPPIEPSGPNRGREATCIADYCYVEQTSENQSSSSSTSNSNNDAMEMALNITHELADWLELLASTNHNNNTSRDDHSRDIISSWEYWAQAFKGREMEVRDSLTCEMVIPMGIQSDGQLKVKYRDGSVDLLPMTDYLL